MRKSNKNYKTDYREHTKGFTLVELLVVISIIALLLSVLMPALGRARSQGGQVVCKSQLRQIGIASQMYAQNNRDYAVPGRWNNGGDWISVNTWYSNLTPYIGSGESPRKVYLMTRADARKYNSVWTKLRCPSERSGVAQSEFQGIAIRTYGINMGCGALAGVTYYDGYGLQDWNRGEVRKLNSIKIPAEMMFFCDTRDWEYVYAAACSVFRTQPGYFDSYLPKRHPRGYNAMFVDGHVGNITTQQLEDSKNRIWRIK